MGFMLLSGKQTREWWGDDIYLISKDTHKEETEIEMDCTVLLFLHRMIFLRLLWGGNSLVSNTSLLSVKKTASKHKIIHVLCSTRTTPLWLKLCHFNNHEHGADICSKVNAKVLVHRSQTRQNYVCEQNSLVNYNNISGKFYWKWNSVVTSKLSQKTNMCSQTF